MYLMKFKFLSFKSYGNISTLLPGKVFCASVFIGNDCFNYVVKSRLHLSAYA